ncbi:hypothetical protein [Oceanobacillus sp. CFH 90083]|uniref:hypothetical protein n=1 Tax=Oceanobacillus sp. CFH 90083 TaxID=2592336 RepID=UPI00128CF7D6|nr:hypothetical protein [Oceanobacillus sp. CFH 90083]
MKEKKTRSPVSKVKSSAKRKVKKSVTPGYGKGGAAAASNPKKYVKKKTPGQPLSKKKRNHVQNITINIETEQKPSIETIRRENKKKTGCASTALLLISVPGIILSSIYYLF